MFKNSVFSNKSFITRNINIIIEKHNLSYFDLFSGNKIKFATESLDNCWRVNMIKEILHMRDFGLFDTLDIEEMNTMLYYICCM